MHRSAKPSLLHILFEFLLTGFNGEGSVKNDWLMPFDPGPSSFPRKKSEPRRRRRPF